MSLQRDFLSQIPRWNKLQKVILPWINVITRTPRLLDDQFALPCNNVSLADPGRRCCRGGAAEGPRSGAAEGAGLPPLRPAGARRCWSRRERRGLSPGRTYRAALLAVAVCVVRMRRGPGRICCPVCTRCGWVRGGRRRFYTPFAGRSVSAGWSCRQRVPEWVWKQPRVQVSFLSQPWTCSCLELRGSVCSASPVTAPCARGARGSVPLERWLFTKRRYVARFWSGYLRDAVVQPLVCERSPYRTSLDLGP